LTGKRVLLVSQVRNEESFFLLVERFFFRNGAKKQMTDSRACFVRLERFSVSAPVPLVAMLSAGRKRQDTSPEKGGRYWKTRSKKMGYSSTNDHGFSFYFFCQPSFQLFLFRPHPRAVSPAQRSLTA